MTLKAYPVAIEIIDADTKDMRAKVTAFDEGAAQVEIHGVVGLQDWAELAGCIARALVDMELTT